MADLFPGFSPEAPIAIDVAPNGKVLLIDKGGMRLCTGMPDQMPSCGTLHVRARSAVFLDAHIVILEEGRRLHTLQLSGTPIGSVPVRPRARALGAAASGSLLVGYTSDADHGIHLERLGAAPVTWSDEELGGVTSIATDSGGVWVAHGPRAKRLRPAPGRMELARSVEFASDVRSITTGPDGALYALLDPGDRLVRLFGDEQGAAPLLDEPLLDIASGGKMLLGCGEEGIADLTGLVPPASWTTPG